MRADKDLVDGSSQEDFLKSLHFTIRRLSDFKLGGGLSFALLQLHLARRLGSSGSQSSRAVSHITFPLSLSGLAAPADKAKVMKV